MLDLIKSVVRWGGAALALFFLTGVLVAAAGLVDSTKEALQAATAVHESGGTEWEVVAKARGRAASELIAQRPHPSEEAVSPRFLRGSVGND